MDKLNLYITANKQKFIAELVKFCAQPSVAAENKGIKEMSQMVLARLKSLGVNAKTVTVGNSKPFILGELKSKNKEAKTLVIYNHYDVQPEAPLELWKTPPFSPTVKGDYVYARGVADDKSHLLLRLQSIETWQKLLGGLPINIKWVIEGEEEIGSPNLGKLAKKYGSFWKDADVCLWEDGGVNEENVPLLSLGLKGILYVELECQFNKRDLHSGKAAIVDSPTRRLISALATLADTGGNVTVDGFNEKVVPPSKAEETLMKSQKFDPKKYTKEMGAEKMLEKNSNQFKFLKRMYFTGTANIAGIWGGYTTAGGVKTILPNKATAKIDFRLVPNQTSQEIYRKLRKHLDKRGFKDITVKNLASEEAGKTKVENKYVQLCIKVLKDVYGKKPAISVTSLGSGPVHELASQFDIPVVTIGCDYPGVKAHAPNENIRISDYIMAMKAVTKFIEALGGMK